MSEIVDLFAPAGGWKVRLLDLSGANAADDDVIETVDGFASLIAANAFARAYVRDSVELCRASGMEPDEVLAAWRAYGEDAEPLDAGEAGWRSETEIESFAAVPASDMERDWRELDPRRADDTAGEAAGGDDPADGDGEADGSGSDPEAFEANLPEPPIDPRRRPR